MPMVEDESKTIQAELRLLDDVVEVAQRSAGQLPLEALDAVLGAGDARTVLPQQRDDR